MFSRFRTSLYRTQNRSINAPHMLCKTLFSVFELVRIARPLSNSSPRENDNLFFITSITTSSLFLEHTAVIEVVQDRLCLANCSDTPDYSQDWGYNPHLDRSRRGTILMRKIGIKRLLPHHTLPATAISLVLPHCVSLCNLSQVVPTPLKSSAPMLSHRRASKLITLEGAASSSRQDSFGRNRKASAKGSSPPGRRGRRGQLQGST